MKQKNELVSIGLPVYNGEDHLSSVLNQLLGQSYSDLELIISDNASTDDTQNICARYEKIDKRIRYFRQIKHLPIANNFEFVLEKAQGNYFMWASDDDWWDKDFVKKLVGLLKQNAECDLAMSSLTRLTARGKLVAALQFKDQTRDLNLHKLKMFHRMVNGGIYHNLIYGIFRTAILKKIFRRQFLDCVATDRILMIEFFLTADFCTAKEVLFKKIISDKSLPERYPQDRISELWRKKLKYSKFTFFLLIRLLQSPGIKIAHKLFIFIYIPIIIFPKNLIADLSFNLRLLRKKIYSCNFTRFIKQRKSVS